MSCSWTSGSGMDGIQATRHITSSPITLDVKVGAARTLAADDYVVAAFRAGAEQWSSS